MVGNLIEIFFEKEIKNLTTGINDNEKVADDPSQNLTEREKACERAQMQRSKRGDLSRKLYELKHKKNTTLRAHRIR